MSDVDEIKKILNKYGIDDSGRMLYFTKGGREFKLRLDSKSNDYILRQFKE